MLTKGKSGYKKTDGFMLIELVVVLLIIIALLLIIVPLTTGYIDDAKENAEISETRAVKVAIQTIINEDYIDDNLENFIVYVADENYELSESGKKKIEKLLDMDVGNVENISINGRNELTGFSYLTVSGSKIIYKDNTYDAEYLAFQ